MSRARVLLLNAALGPLDYRVLHGMAVEPGSIVQVPLGPRLLPAVVWEPERMPSDAEVGDNRLRNIVAVYDLPPLRASLRRLIEWTANYYLAPPAAVLRMALASASALDDERTIVEYRLSGAVPERLTGLRQQALERIGERQGLVRELATIGGVSDGVIRGLVKAGAIEPVVVHVDDPFPAPDPDHAPPALTPDQQAAAAALVAKVRAKTASPTLLDGVTGSGKTEVYFEGIAENLRLGRQTLVLLPEIALTEPFLRRFEA
ncbi:MAG TPA: DEAD/DEAH box helicase family protein, partial [Sphingomonas sp.]|nr:DEAD/DEAH box helicase family protein [Sphingomonas sp.]